MKRDIIILEFVLNNFQKMNNFFHFLTDYVAMSGIHAARKKAQWERESMSSLAGKS